MYLILSKNVDVTKTAVMQGVAGAGRMKRYKKRGSPFQRSAIGGKIPLSGGSINQKRVPKYPFPSLG